MGLNVWKERDALRAQLRMRAYLREEWPSYETYRSASLTGGLAEAVESLRAEGE